ncbi:hemerythrin domain-containing protein [Caenimonas terrae]|uniref:Hemerythrin domain-containing protein n=1 Tax=Caenimonas terrae TaxID=696074 RepID=A0ABW0N9N8_9BURK
MTQAVAYEDAVDLLDADHKGVKALFIKFNALCDDDAPAEEKQPVADKICKELTVHAQIEEEIFYPAVRAAVGDDALMDEALQEHADAKAAIADIQGMSAGDKGFDDKVKALGKAIDEHVLEEREQIFLQARLSALDLRGMAVALFERKKQLQGARPAAAAKKKKVAA